MAKLNRTCTVCGEKYSYCPTCDEDYLKPSWYGLFHEENCKDIFETLCKHYQGYLTSSEAKEVLSKLNLSAIKSYPEQMQNQINEIMSYVEPVEVVEKTVSTTKKILK